MLHKVWAFLNSSFGVWLLSSVVLAWITKTYATWQAHKASAQTRSVTMQRLDTEIAFRLAMALDTLRVATIATENRYGTPKYVYQAVYNCLENFYIHDASNPRDFSLYPEYRKRTFRALLLELRAVVPHDDITDLKTVLDAYEEISDIADTGSLDTSPQASSEAVTTVRALIQTQMIRSRWKPMVDFLAVRGNK
jgi:hypothetical protein